MVEEGEEDEHEEQRTVELELPRGAFGADARSHGDARHRGAAAAAAVTAVTERTRAVVQRGTLWWRRLMVSCGNRIKRINRARTRARVGGSPTAVDV